MKYILLDLGSSFIKSAIGDSATNELFNVTRSDFPPFIETTAHYREVKPEHILKVVFEHLTPLVTENDDIKGILISGQMHGLVLVNSSFTAISNFISWQDQRGSKNINNIKNILTKEEIQSLGNELRPGLPITTLYELKDSVQKPLLALSLMDYVASKLGNQYIPTTDQTNAAATGLFDLKQNSWSKNVLEKLSFNFELPEIAQHGQIVNKFKEIPVHVPIGDQQCALYGLDLQVGELSLNISTGSQVSCIANEYQEGQFQVRPYINRKYIKTITHIPAGRMLNRFIKLFTECSDWNNEQIWGHISKEVQMIQTTELKINTSIFPSAFGNSGSIENMLEENLTMGNIFFALYKNMASNYCLAAEKIISPKSIQTLVFSGGVAIKNTALRSLILKEMEIKNHRIPRQKDDVLIGLLKTIEINNDHK